MRSIRTQFVVLVAVFAAGYTVFVALSTRESAEERVETVTARQAELALAFDLAIREYVAEQIRPFAEEQLGEDEFVPEVMSTSFVARSVFEKVRRRFPEYILKFSSEDPRNPLNLASEEEERIIEYFRVNPEVKEWYGTIELAGKAYQGRFAARRMTDACLRCHGDPEDAPASLLERYGESGSFHRRAGEVVALDSVAIPMDYVTAEAGSPSREMVVGLVSVLVLFGAVFVVFQVVVGRRLGWLSGHFERVASQEGCELATVDVTGRDEVSGLARNFNRMAIRLRELHENLEGLVNRRTAQLQKEVAERRRAERAVRESEGRYRAVLGALDGFILVCDEDGAVEYVNERCQEWLGDNPVGRKCESVAPLFSAARAKMDADRVAEGRHIEVKDPVSERWYDAVDNYVVHGDGRRSVQTVFVDITARKEAEEARTRLSEELRHAQKMEAIGQLAGGIAHDFNNILTAIRGNAELLAMGDDTEESGEYAQDIVTAASRAAELTQQLLTFARKASTKLVAVEVGRLVSEVVDLLRRSIDRRIAIEVSLGVHDAVVKGDPAQLHHALLNLGVNARDAMPDGGRLGFATRRVTLTESDLSQHPTLSAAGDYVEIEVSDTGRGISPDIVDRIFDPFFTTKDPGKGTGLGLASVYGCVKAHRGEVGVESEEGVGTVFRMLLPMGAPEAVVDDEAEQPSAPGVGKGRILVADDEASVRKLAARTLERLGYTVTTCEDGAEALERYRESEDGFDLVILDMTMPRMNGHEAFRAMREIHPGVRAIVASGYMTEEVRQLLEEDGISGVIAKPYRLNDLSKVVAQQLAH